MYILKMNGKEIECQTVDETVDAFREMIEKEDFADIDEQSAQPC